MKTTSRITAFLLMAAMVLSMFSGLSMTASAADYPYNWGHRHTVCDSLSEAAVGYYTGNYDFDVLSSLSGTDSGSSLQGMSSPLYQALQTLMRSTLDQNNSYSQLTTLWKYTDAQDGKAGTQMIYADATSDSYNREHVWPKSRASFYQRNGGCDLHHLRPSINNVNSKRNHWTMGNTRAMLGEQDCEHYQYNNRDVLYLDANYDEPHGIVEVNDNIKGDVARILLYVYVTWGQPNLFEDVAKKDLPKMDSDDDANDGLKVIWDLDTLLDWMQTDPVDTWEMSRNDIIYSMQGNRNVFIDYPELAWMLFSQDIPSDYDTPSGYARDYGTGIAYTLTAVSDNEAYGTVAQTGKTVMASPCEGYAVTGYTLEPADGATVQQNGNYFSVSKMTADCTLTIHFGPRTPATVSYRVPEGVTANASSDGLYLGDTITLPTVSGAAVDESGYDYTFIGWSAEPVEDTTSIKELTILKPGAEYTVTASATEFYAVFSYLVAGEGEGASDEYKLCSENKEDWSGLYVLAAASHDAAMSNVRPDGTDYLEPVSVTIEGDTLYTTNESVIWTISRQNDGSYVIQDCNGLYLCSPGEKKVKLVETVDNDCCWNVSAGYVAPVNTARGTLQYNSGSPRFTTYTSSQKPLSLFEGRTGTLHYVTLSWQSQWVSPFTDVKEGAWYYEAVKWANINGVVNGTSDTTFSPLKKADRAMLVTTLWRMAGSPEVEFENPFADVKTSHYYYWPVMWAAKNGIVNGKSANAFKPRDLLTREQAASILYRYAAMLGLDTSATADLTTFPDGSHVSEYAVPAMQWAVAKGLINGNKINGVVCLDARGTANRGQIAIILMNFSKLISE